jgi:hypothetical protein
MTKVWTSAHDWCYLLSTYDPASIAVYDLMSWAIGASSPVRPEC